MVLTAHCRRMVPRSLTPRPQPTSIVIEARKPVLASLKAEDHATASALNSVVGRMVADRISIVDHAMDTTTISTADREVVGRNTVVARLKVVDRATATALNSVVGRMVAGRILIVGIVREEWTNSAVDR